MINASIQALIDQMTENAIAFCAAKTFGGDIPQTLQALRSGKCEVCDYLCYSLARQLGEYMSQADKAIKAVYVYEPEYGQESAEAADRRSSGINLIVWVGRKNAALGTLAETLNTALATSRRDKVDCSKSTAPCYVLDAQMVDDADVRNRRGYGALVESIYVRPITVWAHPVSEINDIINQEAHGNGSLIAALESIQERFRYLPPEALLLAAERLGVPLSQAYGVATFYNAFSLKPKGKHCLHVCMGTACHVRGSPQVLDRLQTKLGINPGETTRDRQFTLETVNCLGACALGPIVVADGEYSGQATPRKVDQLVKGIVQAEAQG